MRSKHRLQTKVCAEIFFNDRGAGDPIGFSHGWPLSSDAWEDQVPLARAIKNEIKIPVVAAGLITEPAQAEEIVSTGDADLIAIARAALYDPRWPWHAAAVLGRAGIGASAISQISARTVQKSVSILKHPPSPLVKSCASATRRLPPPASSRA